jgi:hypothetical protein
MDRLTIGQAALAGVAVKTVRCSRLVCGPGRPWARCPRSRRYAERRTLASDISCESSGAAAFVRRFDARDVELSQAALTLDIHRSFLERHDVRLAARVKCEVGNKPRTVRKSG